MGVSQSRIEEQGGIGGANCNSDSIETSAGKQATSKRDRSAMSSNTNRRFRMLLPKRRSATRKSDAVSSGSEAKTSHLSSPTPSPIVASFMTNISSRCNPTIVASGDFAGSKAYSSSRSMDDTNSGSLIGGHGEASNTSGLKWPSSVRKQQARQQRLAVALGIPSPVPSVSEPSEDNLSVVLEEEGIHGSETDVRIKNQQNLMQATGPPDERPSVFSCVARSSSSCEDPAERIPPAPTAVTTVQPGRGDLSIPTKSSKLERQHCSVAVVSGIPKKANDSQGSPGVVRSQSMVDKCSSGFIPSISRSVEKSSVLESRIKRPNTLSPYKISGSRSAVAKLCVGVAPLAESECFVIENSPAVEFPPSRGAPSVKNGSQPTSSSNGSEAKNYENIIEINSDEKKPKAAVENYRSPVAMTTTTASRMQSRLKNPSTYATRQRVIYSRYSVDSGHGDSGNSEHGKPTDTSGGEPKKSDASASDSLAISTSAFDSDESRPDVSPLLLGKSKAIHFSPMVTTKRELHDSGVKMDSIYGSSSDATGGIGAGSKTSGSPEGSLYRGLIDDEIRDQPELTLTCKSLERVDQGRSRILTGQDDVFDKDTIGEFGGPIRLRDKLRRQRSNNRMQESYESTVSSLSIDSEDMMLDFHGSMDLAAEETDVVVGCDATSTYSSLGRRSSRNSGGTGSWGRRKARSLASGGKRPSLEAVMDEWASLKHEQEAGPQVHHSRQRALSDLPPSCSVTVPSPCGRILKPPVALDGSGLPSIGLEQQAYRHVVQDVTVMKTLLLRLKRVLQEAETSNPFENSIHAINGLSKVHPIDQETKKADHDQSGMQTEALKAENYALRNQIALMAQQIEDQTRIIQCLQQQLCRQRNSRRSDSALNDSLPESEIKIGSGLPEQTFVPLGSAGIAR